MMNREKCDEVQLLVQFQGVGLIICLCPSWELHVSKSTIHKVLEKRLLLHAFKLQIGEALQPNDRPLRPEFATSLINSIGENNVFLQKVIFSDEATFFVSGLVNRLNDRACGSENPHVTREHIFLSEKFFRRTMHFFVGSE